MAMVGLGQWLGLGLGNGQGWAGAMARQWPVLWLGQHGQVCG